jgi:hypothetical protein
VRRVRREEPSPNLPELLLSLLSPFHFFQGRSNARQQGQQQRKQQNERSENGSSSDDTSGAGLPDWAIQARRKRPRTSLAASAGSSSPHDDSGCSTVYACEDETESGSSPPGEGSSDSRQSSGDAVTKEPVTAGEGEKLGNTCQSWPWAFGRGI